VTFRVSPMTERRLRNFKANRRGYISFWIFLILFILSLFAELIEAGEGLAFAPAGKVFREWVALPTFDEDRWTALIEESMEFVDG